MWERTIAVAGVVALAAGAILLFLQRQELTQLDSRVEGIERASREEWPKLEPRLASLAEETRAIRLAIDGIATAAAAARTAETAQHAANAERWAAIERALDASSDDDALASVNERLAALGGKVGAAVEFERKIASELESLRTDAANVRDAILKLDERLAGALTKAELTSGLEGERAALSEVLAKKVGETLAESVPNETNSDLAALTERIARGESELATLSERIRILGEMLLVSREAPQRDPAPAPLLPGSVTGTVAAVSADDGTIVVSLTKGGDTLRAGHRLTIETDDGGAAIATVVRVSPDGRLAALEIEGATLESADISRGNRASTLQKEPQ